MNKIFFLIFTLICLGCGNPSSNDSGKNVTIYSEIIGTFTNEEYLTPDFLLQQMLTLNEDKTFISKQFGSDSKPISINKGKWRIIERNDTTYSFGEVSLIEKVNELQLYGYYDDNKTTFLIHNSYKLETLFNNIFGTGSGTIWRKN